MKTILVIDNDLGFAFWLGHALDQAGFEALPARSVPDAVKLLQELNVAVDLVMINASLPGAASFLTELRLAQTPFKVIALYDSPQTTTPVLEADATCWKTESVDELARLEWIQTVRAVLTAKVASQ